MDLGLLDVDRRASTDWPIAWTSRLSCRRPAESTCWRRPGICFQLVDVVGDAPPRLVAAELVGKVDVDRALHG
jgi:hypothetical protein